MNPLFTLHFWRAKYFVAFVVLMLTQSIGAAAQVSVTPNQTALALAQKLTGVGVVVSNATLTCPNNANGVFANALSPLGIDSGIILTTGQANTNNSFIGVNGTPATFASRSNNAAGDAALDAIITPQASHDACKLEFDFVPAGDTIKFQYVFGSEEYNGTHGNYNCSISDIFAFFISGPGITGTQNIALVPGTTVPVGVATINDGVGAFTGNACYTQTNGNGPYSQYYVSNYTTATSPITYSGFTVPLYAIKAVTPCQTYHLKLAIADASDYIYDSGVFLKAGSLTSTAISIQSIGGANLVAPQPYCIRNCQPGQFKFQRPAATTAPITIHYLIQGSAINGTDYTFIPDSITIPANATFAVQNIYALAPPYGYDSVIIKVLSPYACGSTQVIIDSAKIYIRDSLVTNIINSSVSICPGQSVQLTAQVFTGPTVFHTWSPATGLSCTSCVSPIATPAVTTTYTLRDSISGAGCTPGTDTVTIIVTPAALPVVISPVNYCVGATAAALSAAGTGIIKWYTTATGGTGSTTAPTPSTATAGTTIYYVSQTNTNNCESGRAPIMVNVVAPPVITVSPTSANPCSGTPVTLTASGGATYSWSPGTGLNATTGATVTATPTTTITYTVTGTTTGPPACSSTATVTVTPKPVPAIASVTAANPTTCIPPNGSLTINGLTAATAYTYSYTLNGGTPTTATQTANGSGQITITGLGAGTYTGITATLNGCTSTAAGPYTLTNATQPATPTITTNSPQCAGSTITLSASTITGATYSWTGPGGYTATGQAASVPNATTAASGTYSVTATVAGCVSLAGTATVVVNPIPSAPSVSTPVAYCVGATATALAAGSGALLWYTTATGGTGSSTAPIPSTAAAGTTIYYVSQTVSGCESPRAAITVTVNPLPVITVTPSAPSYCAGGSVSMTAGGANSYTWSPATGLNTTSGATVTASGSTAQTYTVTGTNGNGCTGTATVTTTIKPLPVVTASSNSPVCAGGTINLTATSAIGTGFSWTGPGSFTSAAQNPSVINASAANAGTYSVTATANGCISAPSSTNVVVNPNVTAPATAQICPGSTLSFGGATISNAGTYTHHFSTALGCDSFVTLTVTISTAITTSFSAAICSGQSYAFNGSTYTASGAYSATFTAQNGCDSIRTLNLTVNPLPAAPTAPSPVVYCQFATAVPLTTTTGSNLLWYTTATGGTGNATAPTPLTTTAGNTTYYVSQTVNSCESPRTPVVVTITAQPAAPSVTSPVNYCVGAATSPLTAPGTGLLWYATATGGTGSGTAPTPSTAIAGSTTYYVSQTMNSCESPRAAITVIVNGLPTVTVNPATATICNGQSISLTASGASTYSWTPATGLNTTSGATVTASPTATTTYSVTGTNAAGCTATAARTVTVNLLPVITATSNSPVCTGGTILLNASPVAGATYSWTGPNAFSAITQNTTIASAGAAQAGTYSVTATLNGCAGLAASTTVVISPLITTNASAQICPGSSVAFGGQTISSAGTYTHTFTTGVGCDSFVTLTVTSNATIATSFSINICGGQSYTFAGSTYTTSGAHTANYTGSNGCDSTSTLNLTVNPLPAAPGVTTPVNYCVGATATPLTATGANLKWYTAATGGTGSATAPTPSTATAGTTVWYVSQTTNSCEGPRAAITVNVNLNPVVTVLPASPTICNGQSVVLTASGAAAYTWTPGSGLSTTSGSAVTASPNGTTTYTVTGTTNNCSSNATVMVTVNPVPTVTASSNTPVCSGSSINLTATGTAGSTYAWTGPGSYSSNAQNPIIAAAATANGGTYTVTATLNGCNSIPAITTVVVNPTPVISNVSGTNPTICNLNNGTITISGLSPNTIYTIAYTVNGSPVAGTSQTSNGAGSITFSGLAAGTYTAFTASQSGCTSTATGSVVLVSPAAPATPVASSNSPVCAGGTLNLSASSSTGGVTYSWSGPNSFSATQQNPSITNSTTTASGTYSVTATLAGCTSAPGTVSVVINPIPAAPVAGSNSPVCSGNSINLTAGNVAGATYAWTGPNSFSSAQQNPSITNATIAAGGTYAVTATVLGCTSAAASTSVIVNPSPVITSVTGTAQTNCAAPNGTITINGLVAGTAYTLSYSLGGNTITGTYTAASSGSIILTGLTSGTYSAFTATLAGCSSAPAGPVTIQAPPGVTAPTAAANSPCEGSTLLLTASTVVNAVYSWIGPNGFTSAQQNPFINNATLAASGTYSVTVMVNGCTSPAGAVVVTVKQIPAVPVASGSSPVCVGNTLTLNAVSSTTGVSYAWTGPNSFTSSVASPSIPNATAAASGTYSVTASLAGCTSTAGTTIVTVNPLPAAPGVTNVVYCQGETATILTATGSNLQWYTTATGGSPLNGAPLPSTATATTYTWYVSQTVGGCEGPRAAITVTINPKPANPNGTPANVTYCQYETAVALSATGTNLLWYTTATGGTGNTTAPVPSTAVPGTYNYYVTQTAGGCESDRQMLTVVVNAKPNPPTVTPVISYCQGDAAAPLSAIGLNLRWYTTLTGGTASSTAPLPNTQAAGNTVYYVSQTVAGCESNRAQIRVRVLEKPSGNISASHHLLCQEDTLTFNYNGTMPVGSVYSWQFPAGSTLLSGSGAGPMIVAFNTPGNFTVRLQVDDSGCQSAVMTYDVTIRPRPALHMVFKKDVCIDERVTVALNQSSPGLHGYVWNFDGAQILSATPDNSGPFVVQWHQAGTYTMTVTATNGECPSKPDTGIVTVHDLPVANILDKASFTDICASDTITLHATDKAGYEYHWSPDIFFDRNGRAIENARVQYSGYIFLNVQNEWSCRSVDSVLVKTHSCCTVTLPDAFSPNGDGRNDVFRMITPAVQSLSTFRIVNRWGQKIWETLRQDDGWDGTYNGVLQNTGVYFYYLKYRCADGKYYEQKGEFTLLR